MDKQVHIFRKKETNDGSQKDRIDRELQINERTDRWTKDRDKCFLSEQKF